VPDRLAALRDAGEADASGESPLIEQRTELAGVGRDGILDASVLAKRLALDPVGISQGLTALGQAHVELQQFTVVLDAGIRLTAGVAALGRTHRDLQVVEATGGGPASHRSVVMSPEP
jgi:hypothetical protein